MLYYIMLLYIDGERVMGDHENFRLKSRNKILLYNQDIIGSSDISETFNFIYKSLASINLF